MKNKNIYILGAGGMAREAYQIYRDLKQANMIGGFVINTKMENQTSIYGIDVKDEKIFTDDCLLIGGIGTPKRKKWISELEKKGNKFDTLVHPATVMGMNVKIGSGSIICANVVLTCDISIGRHTIINVGSYIHHDCKIGNFVTVGPGTTIAGKVTMGDECFIGAGVTIIPGVKIGKSVYVGAGSTVVSDIQDNFMIYGTPAKPIKELTVQDWSRLA
jgi:sugar O-acyltransferase (sialic acid O-acetyltransferase NeuD family)